MDAIACMKAFGMDGYGIGRYEDADKYDGMLKVNSTIVDNEFTGTDLSVQVDWITVKSIGKAITSGRWKAGDLLTTEQAELCTVRWAASFLCAFGHGWMKAEGWDKEEVETWIKENRLVLQHLTRERHRVVDENGQHAVWSLAPEKSRHVGAYQCVIGNYSPFHSLEDYTLEFENALSSYPTSSVARLQRKNRSRVSIYLVDMLLMLKTVGAPLAESMATDFSRRRLLQTPLVKKNALQLYAWQIGNSGVAGDISKWLNRLYPLNLAICSVCDAPTIWRVLEASDQSDIQVTRTVCPRNSGSFPLSSSRATEIDADSNHIFEYTRKWALDRIIIFGPPRFLGVRLAAVRSLLAEWSTTCQRVFDWSPVLPSEHVRIPISNDVITGVLVDDDDALNALICDCQTALHSNVAGELASSNDLPACANLITLFLLALPFFQLCSSRNRAHQDSNNAELGDTEGENERSRYTLYWIPRDGPCNICVEISVNPSTSTASLALICNEANARFVWQHWINAAMGFMKGMDEEAEQGGDSEGARGTADDDESLHVKRRIAKADLSRSILRISTDHADLDMKHLSRELVVFTGWPIFDVRIDTFELNQWLSASGNDPTQISSRISELDRLVDKCALGGDEWKRFKEEREKVQEAFDEEVQKAEEALAQIMDWNRF